MSNILIVGMCCFKTSKVSEYLLQSGCLENQDHRNEHPKYNFKTTPTISISHFLEFV